MRYFIITSGRHKGKKFCTSDEDRNLIPISTDWVKEITAEQYADESFEGEE